MLRQKTTDHPQTLFDVLHIPLVGRLLRWRWGRLVFQIPFTIIALLIIYDGLTGSSIASQNLATVTAWIHYRGFVALAILLVGNLFCMGCPFMLPRTIARRLSTGGRRWPLALRNKWIAIGGLFVFFWLYEWLSLWNSPWLTAWITIAYFAASFTLELVFDESAFCKYVCPLGTFNFVYSTLSPFQIQARKPEICSTCVGKECLKGSYREQPLILIDEIQDGTITKSHENGPNGVLGCGTLLYVPQIKSNMDCTFCLDCARACPHDNVALAARSPLRELVNTSARPKRWDLGFLVVSLAFMGMFNAFGMVTPVYGFLVGMSQLTGIPSRGVLLGIMFLMGNVLAPAICSLGAAWLTFKLTRPTKPKDVKAIFSAFVPAFVPIGMGIWVAHYGYHFLSGALAIIPVFQSFLIDNHVDLFGSAPNWQLSAIASLTQIGLFQVVVLLSGYIFSFVVIQRVAKQLYPRPNDAFMATLPWAILMFALMMFAVWVLRQPMEMRNISPLSSMIISSFT